MNRGDGIDYEFFMNEIRCDTLRLVERFALRWMHASARAVRVQSR